MRLRSNGYYGASGKILASAFDSLSLDPNFFWVSEIPAIWGGFQLISSSNKLKFRHIFTSGSFDLLT